MFGYFNAVTASRSEHPTEDLASAIANARVDGEPLSDIDAVSSYLIVATAGHDTTSANISSGLHALIENPHQLERLRNNEVFSVDHLVRIPVAGGDRQPRLKREQPDRGIVAEPPQHQLGLRADRARATPDAGADLAPVRVQQRGHIQQGFLRDSWQSR
jgi:hypothetical protein